MVVYHHQTSVESECVTGEDMPYRQGSKYLCEHFLIPDSDRTGECGGRLVRTGQCPESAAACTVAVSGRDDGSGVPHA